MSIIISENEIRETVCDICSKFPSVDIHGAFSIFVHHPHQPRIHGHGKTILTLKNAVRSLLEMLRDNSGYIGEISTNKHGKTTLYSK